MKKISIVLLLTCLYVFGGSSFAQSPNTPTVYYNRVIERLPDAGALGRLSADSPLVIVGTVVYAPPSTVVNIPSPFPGFPTEEYIVQDVSVKVSRVLRQIGTSYSVGSVITVRHNGGSVLQAIPSLGGSIRRAVDISDDNVSFSSGENVLLFLRKNRLCGASKDMWYVNNEAFGKFVAQTDGSFLRSFAKMPARYRITDFLASIVNMPYVAKPNQ